nr:MAG TPA: polyVal ADP-ribosyltransferase [Caudoviricetes sp.]
MAQQRKRTAGDDLRDFKAGKISGNFYHNGIDRSDNYIQHTSAPYRMINDKGKVQIASYNEWIQQEVFQHQHELPNGTSSTAVKTGNKNSSKNSEPFLGLPKTNIDTIKDSGIKNKNGQNNSFDFQKAQSDFEATIKNPNKPLEDKVKALSDDYNTAIKNNDIKTAKAIEKEYNAIAEKVNNQAKINQQNAETAEAENAKLAEQAEKEQKYADKYKNSTLEQRKNARIHATAEELDWLNKHMYDNSSSKELEEYKKELSKEYENLYDRGTTGTDENKEARRRNIEDEQDKIDTYINRAKLSEQKKREYDDIVDKNVILKTVMQKYYALQHYDDTKHMLASTGHDTDSIKNQVTLDDYNYINKLSDKERTQIEKNFKNLKKEGYDTESLYKWYERERDAEKAAETTRTSTEYANEHPVLGSIASVGARLGGAVPDAVKYISTDLDKKYNGGDGYINPEETGTAISDAMRAKVSDNINNDFGSFLYNTGMSMADFASLLPLNAVPGGQALSLGIMGTSAGVGAANEVINNGGTIDNAVKTGIASGIAETLFEKVSLEQLSAFKASGKSTFRAAVGNVLKGAFTEGSEEAFTDLANRLTDDAINKDLSSYNLAKKNYMEQGMNEAEAENAASWDFWKNVGLDFAGGAVSGGVLNLATAGVNLAGAKIDMAQNKESNAQIGKAVMADENFDLDLLIRQGLATEKNDKAYNYAHKMQKLVETDNEGKISAGDVGNLMYLINREVAKNPELVNKIAQVKKQDTQEQGNKTVNVQNEQSPTQQNTVQNVQDTAQNGQQNAEQASTVKKADTEDIGKMYGAYAFGKKHPNGIIATDTSTGKVVKVALKSLESSAKINRNDEENTLVFNTNDGKQVNADSITFSDSQLDTIVHSANEFDTYGARNYISNFEEWRESPQAQRMTDDEMLYKYNRAYSAAYSFGREGVKLDSLKETSEYKILINILGEQIVSQALSTGRRDVDINTQHHANRLTELINRNGRADTSGVGVYADSGTEVSHIPQELINTLGNLATKTGRNIIISDRLADGVNGVASDGNIILSSEISSQKILATALHEAGHMIKKTNPTEWRTLSDFVSDYLVRKGVDLNKMIDRTIERYGNRLQADEHENTRDAALEEIVCDTLMSIASDEKALNIALSTKQNKSKIAAAIKSLIAKVKDWLIGKSQNYGAKAFAKDIEALEQLAERFSKAADTARENITEQTEVQNGEKIDVEKYSMGSTDNIVQAEFEKKVDEIEKNTYNSDNVVIMGITPKILQKIGLAPLPLAMTKNHIYSVAVSDTRAKSEGRYHKNTNYHNLGFDAVKDIYNKISDPLMVIAHPDFAVNKNKSKDSTHKVVVLVDLSVGGKQVIAPITVDYEGMYNNTHIDVNLVATYFDKDNINDYIKEAIALETMGKTGFFYLDKKRTQNIFKKSGYQSPSRLKNSGSNIIIRPIDDIVNKKINNITQSKQFIRWFGDWQNSPAKASKVVDNNGEPLVLYHQTGKEFTTFDAKQKGSGEFDSEMPTGIFMKPTNNDIGVGGNIQMPLYASIKNPLIVNNRSELVKFYDKNVQGYTKAKSAIDSVNEEYKAKFNEEMKRENEEYQKLWNAKKNGEISEEEYQKSISRDALDEIMEEWENKVNEASHNAKALIDDYFKDSNYDGVIVNNDVGSFGRSTKTFIAFENTQVKSATDNIGTFDGNNPDIRYSLDEDYDFTDEKAGAIHDTLNFSIDDDLFDLNGNGEQHIDFDKAIDKNNPELTIEQIYHHSARNVKEGLLAGKGIKPEQKKIYNMVKSVMRSYHINPNAETDSLITEYVDALNTFIDSVQNDKSSFTDAFESFVLKCREALQYSTQLDEQHEAWAKEIRDELRGTTLLIPENAIDTIKENYGSVGKYKKALFGKINVKLEHNAKGINGNAVGSYIEDIGSHLENIGGRSLMIEDGFDWDSDSGYRMLDHVMNYVLAPQYVATYDGKFESESTIDAAAIQMAFDTTAEYLKQQGKAAVMQNNIDKKKLRDINKALRQAEKAKTALNQKTIENYKTDIAEQKEKYNKQREKYRQAYNALKDKKSEEAKRYRDKIHELEELSKNQKAIIKTVKDTFRAQYTEKREQTKYMQMLGKKFDKLVKKFDAKSKNTENIPESLKRPILNVLIGFKESADPGQYKNGNQKAIPKYFGAWNNVAEIGEQVRNLYEEYKSLAPKPKDKSEDESTHKGMQYSYIDINTIAYNEQTAQMLEIITDQFAEYATDNNGETIYDADGKPIKIGYKNIFDLDSSDLRLLYDTMTALEASLTQATEIIVNGQRESIAGAAAKALDEVSNVNYNKGVKINVLSKNTVGNKINAALSDMKELSNRFVATSLDPVRYGRFLSGYNDDSIVAKLFKDLHDGDVKREKIMQKAYTKVQSVAYQYSEKDLAKIQKNDVKEFDFRDTETGERVKVSQGIIMSIYLTDQQSSGRRHLLADRLNHYTVLPDLDSANSRRHSKQEKAKSENHHKVRFTFEELQHIKRYVESNKMLREISGAISEVLNNELSQEINEVSMSKYGMLIATVRNYFPISVYGDGAAYEKDFSAEFNDLRMKSRGFIKRRESSYAPIVIDDVFRVFNRHTNSVAEWCGLTTPIENFKKVYNWINTNSLNGTTLHEAIMDKFGKAAEHYIDKLMGDLQKSKDTIDNNLLTRMQGNYMGAVLLLNPGAAVQQFAAFPTANAYFGTKNVAIASAGGMWRVDLEKYDEYTPYLWYRAEGNGTVVGELSREAGVVGGTKSKIDIMGKVDRYVVGCLLKAAELHVEQTTNLKKGSDAFYKEVVRQFEKCVDETQPNNMVTSKPQFIRNNVLKILSMNAFRSQTMAIGNTIIDSYMEYRTRSNDYKLSKSAENKSAKKVAMKKFAKALIGATESALLIGGLKVMIDLFLLHKWDDERDDEGNVTAENIFKNILDYSMESFAGTFTFGDTTYSAIAHMIDNDRPFYGLDSMSLENINNIITDIQKGDAISAVTLLGDCFRFPASNIKRMALSLTSYFTDLTKGRGEIISDNKGNINTTVLVPLMINATIDGDADKAQYYEQLYVNTIMGTKGKTEKEARDMLEQKVITALSKNNDDVEKAAVARANGDLNTYESLINKVSSYGFGKDDVIKASDKVISNIIANMKKEGITDEDDAKSDLVDNQGFTEQGAEYVWKKMSSSVDNEKSEESIFDSTGNDDTLMYKYTDAFEYLKNGDTENYEKVEKYLMEHKGKTKNQMKKLMQSVSRTDPIFEKYIEASKNNDADTTHTLYRQLLNIYGSESKFKSALRKYRDKIKKQQSK